ncbi:MAG: substrate-binding domain-containing protein [Oscillospiraceae bacterium]|nr:substrate-binding domain-containing protein [Oscillospiraceae bacterium]
MNKRIGVIIARPYYTVNRPQICGILKECYRHGDSAYVFSINEEFYYEQALPQAWNILHAVDFERLDGVVYVPYSIARDETKQKILEHLRTRCHCPVVMISTDPEPYPTVWFDERALIEAVTSHLIAEHGCRDILCLTGPAQMQTSASRAQGWRDALEKAGIPVSEERLVYGDFWINAPKLLANELADGTRPMPEAIVCGNDRMALTLCDALEESGIRVPEDVLVTGFDGIIEAELHNPSITTCVPDWEQLGTIAMQKLYCLMEATGPEAIQTAGYRLLLGESCGHQRQRSQQESLKYNMLESRYLDTAIHSIKLSDDNITDLMNSIYNATYFYASTNYPEYAQFSCCLCSDWNQTAFSQGSARYRTRGYSEEMLLMQRFGTGKPFPLTRMVPEEMDSDVPSVTYFVPLYFHDRCFGYTLLRLDGIADSYDIYYLKFCVEIGSALAFFCLQNEYRSFAYRSLIQGSRDALTGLYLFDRSLSMCEEMASAAQLYGETLYLLVLHLGGLQQVEDAQNRMEKDRLLLAFSDILVRNCRGREQVFLAEEGTFYLLGSGVQPQERTETLRARIAEEFRTGNIPHQEIVWLTSAVRLMEPAGLTDFSEIPEMLRQMADTLKNTQQPTYQEKKHRVRLTALRQEIYAHPERAWTAEQCAGRLCMSQSYFFKIYRNCFGTSCSQDIQRSKIAYAKKLLLQTDMILQDIADRCGYDYSHFMRLFKKEVGMTPTAYRKGAAV